MADQINKEGNAQRGHAKYSASRNGEKIIRCLKFNETVERSKKGWYGESDLISLQLFGQN